MNNTAAIEMVSSLPGLRNFEVKQEDSFVIDEERRMIMIHARGTGLTDVGQYSNEYIFTLFTTYDGMLVRESSEFVDSFLTKEFNRKLSDASA